MSISLTQPAVGSTNWGSQANTNWQTLQDAINNQIIAAGTQAAQPAASSTNSGFLYFATDTQILYRSDGSNWVQVSGGARRGVYGDGNDGSLVFDGSTTILGMVPVANAYTLTRDIYPSQMTVNTGVSIIGADFRVVCKGTLTLSGTAVIKANGANAVGVTAGAGITGPGTVGCFTGAGGNGKTGAGVGSNSAGIIKALGGNGGSGGAGGGNAGGTSVGASPPTAQMGGTDYMRALPMAVAGSNNNNWSTNGGDGGGGGGATASDVGGGGGAGGAAVIVAAPTITGSGSITANGGNGGNASGTGTGAGGGGGGGGGWIVVVSTLPAAVTLSAAGGSGGTGIHGGANGVAGSAGRIYQIIE